MGLGGQRHATAALPPVKTRYPLYWRLGGPQGQSGRVRKVSLSPGFDPRTVQPVASRYTDWAIAAPQTLQMHDDNLMMILMQENESGQILWDILAVSGGLGGNFGESFGQDRPCAGRGPKWSPHEWRTKVSPLSVPSRLLHVSSICSRTPLIRKGETSGYAGYPDNWNFLCKIRYIGSLQFGCYCVQYVPASKPFDHAWYVVPETVTLCCTWSDNR
jgi:hypothetical protein